MTSDNVTPLYESAESGTSRVDTSEKRREAEGVDDEGSWVWGLFDATWTWVLSGGLSKLEALPKAPDHTGSAAAAVVRATAMVEVGRPQDALVAIRTMRGRKHLDPIDIAWLKSHESRCLIELGKLEEARDLALEVQSLRAVAPADPTAKALIAVTTTQLFDMSGFGARDLGELIQSIDTSTRWWRSQTIARGLEKHFDDQFKSWGRDSAITWASSDTVWTSLRSATLLSGLSADHDGWRHAMSLLARRDLMKASSGNDAAVLESLRDLLLAGAKKELVLAVRKLSDDGPVEPLVSLIGQLKLESTPRSCLQSALACLRSAGDFARTSDADRHAAWLISVLDDPDALRRRLRPHFLVETAILEALGGLMVSMSSASRRRVIDHILSLSDIEDQSIASGYGRIVRLVGDDEWTPDDLRQLSARTGDNWELQDDIDGVLATHSAEFRTSLIDKIRQGDLTALGNFGRITDLPLEAAKDAIEQLAKRIGHQVEEARSGCYALGGPELGQALVVLNAWHDAVANWDAVERLLAEPKSHPSHIVGTLDSLGKLAERIPDAAKDRLRDALRDIGERPPYERETLFSSSNATPQSFATLAILRIFPDEVTDSTLRRLVAGPSADREVVATIAGDRRAVGDYTLVLSLTADPNPQVRLASIVALVKWFASEDAQSEDLDRVRELVNRGGPITAKRVSGHLVSMPQNEARDSILRFLAHHPSALVRTRVAAYSGLA